MNQLYFIHRQVWELRGTNTINNMREFYWNFPHPEQLDIRFKDSTDGLILRGKLKEDDDNTFIASFEGVDNCPFLSIGEKADLKQH